MAQAVDDTCEGSGLHQSWRIEPVLIGELDRFDHPLDARPEDRTDVAVDSVEDEAALACVAIDRAPRFGGKGVAEIGGAVGQLDDLGFGAHLADLLEQVAGLELPEVILTQ